MFYMTVRRAEIIFLALAAAEVGAGTEQFSSSERRSTHQK